MVIKICPRCNRRYSVSPNTIDFEHDCDSGVEAIDNEDIVVIGGWQDYAGSAAVSQYEVRSKGTENKLFGTRAALEGENLGDLTSRGNRISTHRTRHHLEFIKTKDSNS